MGWIAGLLLAAAIAAAWWWSSRCSESRWSTLEKALEDLAEGRAREGRRLAESGRAFRLSERLEQIAAMHERLRQQISREEFNLAAILASMEEGVMVVDAQHVLRRFNPSFLELFDLRIDPRGQTALHTLREPQIEEMIAAALKTSEPQTAEVSTNARKGQRHYAVNAVPIRDSESQQGVVMIFRDISRLKKLEDVRREFVANVSHELRTPLSIFHGYLENLVDNPTMPRQEQAEVYAILRKHSMRLNALLEDLLILARLESRHDKLQRETMQLKAFMRTLVADWQKLAAKKKIVIASEAAPGLPALMADPLRLEQVFNNLLENAIKYTAEGGRIYLRAAQVEADIEVCVEDTGIGIPPAELPHIFERFFRADKARSREQGGTGLGLSIVKHIVQSHGGRVSAWSTYGKGTTICFRLPLEPPAA